MFWETSCWYGLQRTVLMEFGWCGLQRTVLMEFGWRGLQRTGRGTNCVSVNWTELLEQRCADVE
jgi:hypothetical protein